MKSRGFPEPLVALDDAIGAVFGLDAANSWSRKRYSAARMTPTERITISETEEAIIMLASGRRTGGGAKVVRLGSAAMKTKVER